MDPELWNQAMGVVERVHRLPREQWQAAVAKEVAGDERLQTASESLLQSLLECPDEFLAEPPGQPQAALVATQRRIACALGQAGFLVEREIGRGSTGVVFLARQVKFDRTVAVKVVDLGISATPRRLERFAREAESMAALQHPGILSVFDHGRIENALWFAMEFVEGHDLSTELALDPGDDVRILPDRGSREHVIAVARVCAEVAEALHHAHGRGVVHRDVKPHNILLHGDGRARIADFGLARLETHGELSRTGGVVGTPYYMSPEQVMGDRESIGLRTDVYSLGVVMFEMLTRRRPHDGKTVPEVLNSIVRIAELRVRRLDPSLSHDIETICLTAMAHTPADRYATARAFAEDLRRLLEFQAIRAVRPGAWHRLAQFWRRHHAKAIGAVGLCLVMLFIAVWASGTARSSELTASLDLVESVVESSRSEAPQFAALAVARSRVDQVLDIVSPEGEVGRRASHLRDRIESVGQTVLDTAERRIEAFFRRQPSGIPGQLRPRVAPLVAPRFFSGVSAFGRAARLLPGRETRPEKGNLEHWYPRLTIRSIPDNAEVALQPVNWVTGNFGAGKLVGRTPIVDVSVAPGHYRVVVSVRGHGFAELTRWLGSWGERYDLGSVEIRDTRSVIGDMARVDASEQGFIRPDRRPDRGTHAAFWMDRYEVSNSDYAGFLVATGNREVDVPGRWNAGFARRWKHRPVVGVSVLQARRYAEWAGKRLPTELEWSGAARGTEEWQFPWQGESVQLSEVAVACGARYPQTDEEWTGYGEWTRDVREGTLDETPNGILNLAGNISEWTDSSALDYLDGVLFPMVGHQRIKGWNWRRMYPPTLKHYAEEQGHAPSANDTIGFRCAKSLSKSE